MCLFLCSLLQVYPVRSRFRHRHMDEGLLYPLAGSSLDPTIPNCNLFFDLFRCIARPLEGSLMFLHLSVSPCLTSSFWLGCGQTGSECLVPSGFFSPLYHIHLSRWLDARFPITIQVFYINWLEGSCKSSSCFI